MRSPQLLIYNMDESSQSDENFTFQILDYSMHVVYDCIFIVCIKIKGTDANILFFHLITNHMTLFSILQKVYKVYYIIIVFSKRLLSEVKVQNMEVSAFYECFFFIYFFLSMFCVGDKIISQTPNVLISL